MSFAVPYPFTFTYERVSPLLNTSLPSVRIFVLFKVTVTFCFPVLAGITAGDTVKPLGAVILISFPGKAAELTKSETDSLVPLMVNCGKLVSTDTSSVSFLSSLGRAA